MPLKVHPRLHLDIGWGDLWFALTSGARSRPEASLRLIRKAHPNRPSIATLSVRTGFLALLQALKPPRGAEILMSAVNIANMADIVRACGLVPVPVDIDLDTLAPTPDAIRAGITDKTVLYLHAHLYGSRNIIEAVGDICRVKNILFVEDCAQAYDGRANDGRGWDGSREADISLFSFGPIKPATTLGGAVMRIRDPDLYARINSELDHWPEQDAKAVPRRARKLTMLKALSQPNLYALVLAALRLCGANADAVIGAAARGFPSGDLIEQIMKRPSPRLLALMARRLSSPPENAWRRACAARLRTKLRADITTLGARAAHHAYWLFPILVESPAEVIAALQHQGFDATRGATSMRVIEGGHTPNAHRLIGQVVYLPLSPSLRLRDLDRMAAIVNLIAAGAQAKAA